MPTINFSGLASGIDTQALVEAILNVERQPLTRIENKRALFSQRKAALDELSAKLSGFQGVLEDLASGRAFRGTVATVGDETALRVTPGAGAELGLFDIVVNSLAAAHKVKSDGVAASDEALVADGTITIQSGSNDPITIDVSGANGNNSLVAIRNAINAADAGVRAAVLYDGTEYRLTVRAEETGTANALIITDGTDLNLGVGLNNVKPAADAALTIDGIAITSSKNQITSAIPGVTLDLLDTTAGETTTVEVSQNIEGVSAAIQSLLDGYNELIDFFNTQNRPEGVLRGDATARSAEQRLRRLFSGGVEGVPIGQIRALSSLGVSFDGQTGRATLDASELGEVLETHFEEVGSLFVAASSATHSAITLLSRGSADPGSYAVEITQAAEQAAVVGSTVITALDQAETLTIMVGTDQVDVLLSEGDLIGDVVDKINAALTGAGIDALASDDAGRLRIGTEAYGSDATLTVVSDIADNGDGARTGFDDSPASDLGQDVAGSIGGFEATGVGRTLTAAEGQVFSGISLLVTAGAADVVSEGGAFGTAEVADGFVQSLLSAGKLYTRTGDGLLGSAADDLETRIKRLGDDILRVEERLRRREIQLINQFTAAENAISALTAQQSTLGSFRLL